MPGSKDEGKGGSAAPLAFGKTTEDWMASSLSQSSLESLASRSHQANSPPRGTLPTTNDLDLPHTVGSSKSKASLQNLAGQLTTPPLRPIVASNTDSSANDSRTEMLVAKLEAFYELVNPGK